MSMNDAAPRRPAGVPPLLRLLRFRLRTLLLVTLLLGVLLAPYVWRRDRARRQAELVLELKSAGARMLYDYQRDALPGDTPTYDFKQKSPVPSFLLTWLGPDFFHQVELLQTPPESELDTFDRRLFQRALTELTDLRQIFFYSHTFHAEDLELIGRQQNVEILHFTGVAFDEPDLRPLGKLQQIEGLNFSGTSLEGCDLSWLQELPRLRRLTLHNVAFGRDRCPWLAQLSQVESLGISSSDVDDQTLKHLQGMTHLRSLSLNSCLVSGNDVDAATFPPQLKFLSLSYTPLASCEWISGLSELRHFVADHTSLSAEDVLAVNWPPKIEAIQIRGTQVNDAALEKLSSLENLEVLRLTSGGYSPVAMYWLQDAIPDCYVSIFPPTRRVIGERSALR